jgi:prolyl oligopeptidase
VDSSSVVVKQVFTTSPDGTRVPYFLVHRKDVRPDGDNACLIYGYGGFNISMEPRFISSYFPWFEAGGVLAIANLRGGGEYGEAWHRAGMLESKQNVFDDLYAVAEHLIETKWTTSSRLAVMGGSNGGLLTGVAATQRPDLFACAISSVPLLDMLRYQQFLMATFWVPEYGSSEDPQQFEWLRRYSPYHNIEKGADYPAMLITAGENDNRVHPLHARKMAARLQARAGNDQNEKPILLWVDRDAGHGSGKPLELRIRDLTDIWSFIMWQTGLCR